MSAYTRADYMGKRCTHREYYGQFVSEHTVSMVGGTFGDDLRQSSDPHLNDIPIRRWDSFATCYDRNAVVATEGSCSIATHVCILKEAARQWLEADRDD